MIRARRGFISKSARFAKRSMEGCANAPVGEKLERTAVRYGAVEDEHRARISSRRMKFLRVVPLAACPDRPARRNMSHILLANESNGLAFFFSSGKADRGSRLSLCFFFSFFLSLSLSLSLFLSLSAIPLRVNAFRSSPVREFLENSCPRIETFLSSLVTASSSARLESSPK